MEGAKVYVQDANSAWQKATVEAALGQSRYRVRLEPWEGTTAPAGDSSEVDASKLEGGALPFQNTGMPEHGFPNMTTLDHLHEAALLHNLRVRFFAGSCPYTYTADIVIAVNPYRWFPDLYTDEQRKQYLVYDCSKLPPHVYATSSAAYAGLTETKKDQAILVSGESGAGKTETVKILMAHLALIASSDDSTHIKRIVESNPLLESFGNAQTVRNDNSSRFGKFIELQLNGTCRLVGSKCRTYLLEKSRVVSQDAGERNYHIFYQMLAADEQTRSTFSLGDASRTRDTMRYTRLGGSKTQTIEGQTDAQRFKTTTDALALVGVQGDILLQMLQALAGVLLLGQIEFVATGSDGGESDSGSQITPETVSEVAQIAEALRVDKTALTKAITERTIKMRNETFVKPLPLTGALAARDATAKELYARLFDWLVGRICAATSAPSAQSSHFVGLLDIFGFESFAINRFEQLCINYANEKLQQKFTLDVFKAVQQEYSDEGIPWDRIEFKDNAPLLALIESKLGIVAMLNEECVRPKGSDENFVSKLSTVHKADPAFSTPKLGAQRELQFAIKHYAGSVMYTASGWLERNKDTISDDVVALMRSSENPLVKELFTDPLRDDAGVGETPTKTKMGSDTVVTKFKTSLAQLMETIGRTSTQYVRCIKPNKNKSPGEVDNPMVVEQLRCAGVIEAIRISRAGFPARMPLKEFVQRFHVLVRAIAGVGFSKATVVRDAAAASAASKAVASLDGRGDKAAACRDVVAALVPGQGRQCEVGRTRVYFKAGVLEALEESRALLQQAAATELARRARGSQQRRCFARKKHASLRIQTALRMSSQRRAYLRALEVIVACQACRRSVLARRRAFELKQQRCACRLQAYQRRRMAMAQFSRARRAAVRLQAAFRRWAGRRKYLVDLANFKEQAKLENQVRALQARLEAKEREARAREAGGAAEPPAEILETLNTLTAENAKLRAENERQRAEIEKLREENRHLRTERAAKDEVLHSLRRVPKETAAAGAVFSEPQRAPSKLEAASPAGADAGEDAAAPSRGAAAAALQLCAPLSHFWEDVPSEMIPLLKNGTEVHIKLGSHVLLLDEKDDKRLTWKSWMTGSRGYRRSMAFIVERRSLAGDADPRHPELGDDNSIGAAFALRSALTGKYATCYNGVLHAHFLRVTGNRPEDAAVFTCIPLLEGSSDGVGMAAEYLCSIRLLSEKRFLRLRTDGHVAMVSVSDPDVNIRHDKMAVAIEKLLPRASYEITVDVNDDQIGITLSKDLPLRVCSLAVMAEPSCAERTGRVHVGDLLTTVNSQDIAQIPCGDVVQMITCKKPVTLGFTVARDLSGVVGQLPTPRDKEPVTREKRHIFSRFQKAKVTQKLLEATTQKPSEDVIEL